MTGGNKKLHVAGASDVKKNKPKVLKLSDQSPHSKNGASSKSNVATKKTHKIGSLYSGVGVVAISIVSWFVYQGYLETRVNSPLTENKVVFPTSHDFPERYWGSFRPGVYFGMKSRDTHSLLAGLMWFMPDIAAAGNLNLRHLCDQGDNLEQYGWREHDGRNFGVQPTQHIWFLGTSLDPLSFLPSLSY